MGLEYITQPQVFLAPITAVNGVQGVNNPFPLITTYQSWVSTGAIDTTTFPIPGTWTMLDAPGSFIVTVGNVIQSPTDYSINRNNRQLTFTSPVTAGIEVGVTQLATAAPSAIAYNQLTAVNSYFVSITAIDSILSNTNITNSIITNVTATNNFLTNITATNSFLTNVTATNINVTRSLLSNITADGFIGNSSQTVLTDGTNFSGNGNNTLSINYLSGVFINAPTLTTRAISVSAPSANTALNVTGVVAISAPSVNTALSVAGNVTISNNASAANITTQGLSSRFINLEHTTPNDGVNPVLYIGERGDGTNGTVVGSLTGFNIIYNEQSNDLIVATQFGAVTPLTAIDINVNGFVGVNCNPNQPLTVTGNVSATGDLFSNNSLLSFGAANTTNASPGAIFYGANSDIVLDANSRYEITFNLYYSKITTSAVTYALSSTVALANVVVNYIHQPVGGLGANGATTGAGIVAQTGPLIALPAIAGITTGVNHNATIKALVETSAAARLNLAAWNGVAATITPLRGSYWTKTRINAA